MSCQEEEIWKYINNSKKNSLSLIWLEKTYSLRLSKELRYAIAEKLGLLNENSWATINKLLQQYGMQPELIHAAGLCHQNDAKKWLLKNRLA